MPYAKAITYSLASGKSVLKLYPLSSRETDHFPDIGADGKAIYNE
jgi:hypothetical protein